MPFTITYEKDGDIVLEFGTMMTLRVSDRGVAFDREAVEAVADAAHNHIQSLVASPQSENKNELDEFLDEFLRSRRHFQWDWDALRKTGLHVRPPVDDEP